MRPADAGAPAAGVPSGWTLALDTATPATVVAAVGPTGGTLVRTASRIETPAPGERPAHTRRLLVLADEVLRQTGGSWATIARVVVGLGPGTFTGIRVGVSTARGIVLAAGADAVGVPTPAALAMAALASGGPTGTGTDGGVLVVQDARRGELFLTLVGAGDLPGHAAALRPWSAPQDALADVVRALPERPAVAVGDGALARRDELEALGVAVPGDPARHAVDGLALAAAAAELSGSAPDDLRPLYVRDADAVPTAERR